MKRTIKLQKIRVYFSATPLPPNLGQGLRRSILPPHQEARQNVSMTPRHHYSRERVKMINHIATAKIMSLELARYHRFVSQVEDSGWFQDMAGQLKKEHFPHKPECKKPTVLGTLSVDDFRFSCPHFAVTFNWDKFIHKGQCKLWQISQRNRATWRLMDLIRKHQQRFLKTGSSLDLVYWTYKDVIQEYKELYPDSYIDASMLSRIIKGKSLETQSGERLLLSEFFPRKWFLHGVKIKHILETVSLTLTDEELCQELRSHFDIKRCRRYVSDCRKKMGIAPARLREHDRTLINVQQFSLTYESLRQLTPVSAGVYEVLLAAERHAYPAGESPLVYIGATKDFDKRFGVYLGGWAHTQDLRRCFEEKKLTVRIHRATDHFSLEAQMIHEFEATMGALPLLNKLRPKLKVAL